MRKLLLLTISISLLSLLGYSQGVNCLGADPFCTGTTYSFPNNTGTSAESGPNYGCLGSQPNPAWYYLQIDQSGDLDIGISQVNGNGSGIDVDFIAWGPFVDPSSPCTAQLTSGNTVDCSYSTSATETANITGAVTGEYYILLITNYANVSGNITFSQTGGSGSTDCSIVVPSCPTVGFHGEDASANSYNLPLSLDCTTDGWLFLRANDAATAGGPITPTAIVNVATNGEGSGNNLYGYENNGGTWNAYWGATNIPANTNYSFTMYEMDNVTASSFAVEMCDVYSAGDMSFTIQDGNCGNTTIYTGSGATAWDANDGTNSGAAGPIWDGTTSAPGTTSGCTMISFPTSAVSGTASYSCPTCPPSSFVTTDFGWAYFNPAEAGPGTYDITYCFDNGCGCQGCATETITVNNPYDATFSYANAQYCSDGSDPTPTITQTGGLFSAPAGLSINTSTGAIDLSTSTPGNYNVTYTIGGGATDYSGNCNDTHVESVEILTPPSSDAGSPFTITCVSNVGGSSIGASSSAGLSYSWSPTTGLSSSTASDPNANPSGTTAYTVTTSYTSLPSCSSTDNVTVTVDNTAPTADAGSDVIIDCNSTNGEESLDGSGSTGGMDYSWSAGPGTIVSGGTTTTPTVNAAGTYTILVTNSSNGCTDSDDMDVTTDLSTPTASIATPSQIDCASSSTTVDGSGSTNSAGGTTGLTYSWSASNGGVISGSTTGSTISATAAGDYTIVVTQANGCTDTEIVSVTADSNVPTAVIIDDATLTCDVTSITLDGSTSLGSNLSYEWQDGTSSTIGTNTTLGVSTPDTYTLIVTNTANSCSNSTSVIIAQDITIPSVVVNSPVVVDCNDPIATLDGSGSDQGANFTYTWSNPGTGIILGTGNTDTDSTSTADTYTLTILNTTNGCSDAQDIIVSMDTVTPFADAGTDVNFPCGVTTVALDGSASSGAGISYNWTGPGVITNGTSPAPDVDGTGTFTLVVTGSNGCTDTDDVDVNPDSNAPVADAGTDITITCNDLPWNVTLDGSGSDAGANITYSWATSGTGNITNGTTTSPSVDQEGAYTVTVTNTSNSCTATATVNVLTDTIAPTSDAGIDTVISCNSGLVVILDGTNSAGTNITYNWTTSNGTIDSQSSGNATVSAAGDYDLTITGDNGCTNTDQITVTMDTITPAITIVTPSDLDCIGTPVILDASGSTGLNESYLWSDATTGNTTSVTTSGTYILVVTNDNGCSTTDSVTVNDVPGPTADFSATPTSGNIPLDVDFTDNSSGTNLTYNWDLGNNTTSTTQHPSTTYQTVGTFEVILVVTDDLGCTDSDTLTILTEGESMLVIPNIFSPNGDGNNDVFTLQGTNISEIKGTIFNRWGQIVYEFDALGAGWDGHTISGAEAATGTYYYLIEALGADGIEYDYQGPFQLIR